MFGVGVGLLGLKGRFVDSEVFMKYLGSVCGCGVVVFCSFTET